VILPYALRLLCVCLASFFLLHLALALLARLLARVTQPWTARVAVRDSARAAAFVLGIRLLPAALSIALVLAFCAPSFLSFESERGSEIAGFPFLATAGLGAAVWAISAARSLRALRRSRRCLAGAVQSLPDGSEPFWLWEGPAPLLALAGVFRPRVVVSSKVVSALDANQFSAALRHEWAHHAAGDNLKRLLLLLAPEPLPGISLFGAMDRAWARFAEWAADDRAAGCDPERSISLAEALVRVAKLGAAANGSPLLSSFVPLGEDISTRVERLLTLRAPATERRVCGRTVFIGLAAAPFLAGAIVPGALNAVHQILERLMH
jgi:hypothetical protein